jgi:hypothetical protein
LGACLGNPQPHRERIDAPAQIILGLHLQ